ncbi:MAG: right-handed parallel beta-helix repeat-containing protein [Caldilineales bacterium]
MKTTTRLSLTLAALLAALLPAAAGAQVDPPVGEVITTTVPLSATAPITTTTDDQPAVTFVVNSTNDPGNGPCNASECTLREAIIAANANGSSQDTIQFNIPGAGPHVITLAAAMQPISQPLIVDGLSQPGASCNGLPADPRIVVNGSGLGGGETGLTITAGSTQIKGLVIQRFPSHGVVIQGSGGVTLDCNYIGTNAAGINDLGNGGIGVYINNSPNNSLVRNLISGNGSFGVYVGGANAGGNVLRGNRIGTNETATAAIANDEEGVLVESAPNTRVGGTSGSDRNIISGNHGYGVALNGSSGGSSVLGNYIGVNVGGTGALANYAGISVAGVNGATIGGTQAGAENVVSGNTTDGIILQSNANNLLIARNRIGVTAGGGAKLPNGGYGIYIPNGNNNTIGGGNNGNIIAGNGQDGIFIFASSTNNQILANYIGTNQNGSPGLGNSMFGVAITMAPGNRVGAAGQGNVIAFNGADGVYISGDSATGNAISANTINDNGGLGIDLGDNGVTPNDNGDPDVGPNGLQNFPLLSSAGSDGSQTRIAGTLNSLPNRTFRLEFFASPSCDPSGYGEGRNYLGTANVTTNGSGNASFTVTLATGANTGWAATATASDTAAGNQTSEFSQCKTVVQQSFTRKLWLPSVLRSL